MGVYLNPNIKAFKESIDSEIYVDKSEMIMYLNTVIDTNQKYVSVSRPRRFGKTMATNMICAYYDRMADSHALFESSKLASCEPVAAGDKVITWDEYLGKFNCIKIVMTNFI